MQPESCDVSRWQVLKTQLNNLTPAEFNQAIEKAGEGIVIDVRTAAEYENWHFQNAINIDYLSYDFWDKMELLDADQTYYIYCRSGRRSIRTCTLMKNGGFTHIFNLDGGLNAWSVCDLPQGVNLQVTVSVLIVGTPGQCSTFTLLWDGIP